MPMTEWDEIAGEKCQICGGYATHFFGSTPVCCQCHGGDLFSQAYAQREHERILAERARLEESGCETIS